MRYARFTLFFSLCLSLIPVMGGDESSDAASSDEKEFAFIEIGPPLEWAEVEVTVEQSEKLFQIERSYAEKLGNLYEQVCVAKKQLQSKEEAYQAAQFDILTPAQRDSVDAEHRENVRYRMDIDVDYLAQFLPVLKKLRRVQSMTLLEGPERTETKLPVAPQDDGTVIHVKEHFFFKEPLVLTRDDEISLLDAICNYKAYGPHFGKLCGGFHPDVHIQLETEEGAVQMLVCFGCAEAKFLHGEAEAWVDIEEDAYRQIKNICERNFRKRGGGGEGQGGEQ